MILRLNSLGMLLFTAVFLHTVQFSNTKGLILLIFSFPSSTSVKVFQTVLNLSAPCNKKNSTFISLVTFSP